MTALLAVLSFLAGIGLAVQAGANARLAQAVGTPFVATAMQLAVGAAILLGVAASFGALPALARLGSGPWWHAVGGAASAVYVLAVILVAPRLGAVVAIGVLIAGQTFASLLLDGFGILGVPHRGFPPTTLVGAGLTLAGVAALVRGQAGEISTLRLKPGLLALALFAGALLPFQGAVNALFRADLGAPLAVGFVSFVVATVTMLLVLPIIHAALKAPSPRFDGLAQMPAWGWLGGVMGAFYVMTVFSAIPSIGAASVVALTVAGQQAASLLIDRVGLLGFPMRAITSMRLWGVMLLFAGVAVIQLMKG
jgi:bacterial/archaeal transporter family-2 protein